MSKFLLFVCLLLSLSACGDSSDSNQLEILSELEALSAEIETLKVQTTTSSNNGSSIEKERLDQELQRFDELGLTDVTREEAECAITTFGSTAGFDKARLAFASGNASIETLHDFVSFVIDCSPGIENEVADLFAGNPLDELAPNVFSECLAEMVTKKTTILADLMMEVYFPEKIENPLTDRDFYIVMHECFSFRDVLYLGVTERLGPKGLPPEYTDCIFQIIDSDSEIFADLMLADYEMEENAFTEYLSALMDPYSLQLDDCLYSSLSNEEYEELFEGLIDWGLLEEHSAEISTTTTISESIGEQNARKGADEYLEYSTFSRMGLIEQLMFEGFTLSESEYGVDVLNVDWNEQAALSADEYLEYSTFSRMGLIEQLMFEGFTLSESEYGVDVLNVDWNEQAALSADEYLEYSTFSRMGLIEQLMFEGFTLSESEYGATAVGYNEKDLPSVTIEIGNSTDYEDLGQSSVVESQISPSWFYKYNPAWTEAIDRQVDRELCSELNLTLNDLHQASDALKSSATLEGLIADGFWIFDVKTGAGLLSKIEHELEEGYFDDLIGYIYDGVDQSTWVGDREFDIAQNRNRYECDDDPEWILRRDTWREGNSLSSAQSSPSTDLESSNLQNPGDSKNCGDFSTYEDAKLWFDKYFGDFGDISKLDADDDGEPCESLPGGP